MTLNSNTAAVGSVIRAQVTWCQFLRIIVIIIIMEKTEAGLKCLCIREIAVKSHTLIHEIL